MSKFDRCIFISIAIGIWALAMTQVFKPDFVKAEKYETRFNQADPSSTNVSNVIAKCPNDSTNFAVIYPSLESEDIPVCFYQLVVTYSDLMDHKDHFSKEIKGFTVPNE